MKPPLIALIITLLNLTAHLASGITIPQPTESYTASTTFNESCQDPNPAMLYWKHTNETIQFELITRSSDWLLFGLYGEDSVDYSDVFLTWLNPQNDGYGHFSDRRLAKTSNCTPTSYQFMPVDRRQDWLPISVFTTSNDYTVYKFQRSIKLFCDDSDPFKEDLNFKPGLIRLILIRPSLTNAYQTQQVIKTVRLFNETSTSFTCSNKNPQQRQFNSTPTSYYANQVDLIANGTYRLYWNYTDEDFVGEVHVRTTGWVGFGLSPSGESADAADMIVGWVGENGVVNFTDRFVNSGSFLHVDPIQNWFLIAAAESGGYTVLKFVRKLVLCNMDDRIIEVFFFTINYF
jgi:hypothetical protein